MGFSRQEYWSGLPLPSPMACRSVLNNKRERISSYHLEPGGKCDIIEITQHGFIEQPCSHTSGILHKRRSFHSWLNETKTQFSVFCNQAHYAAVEALAEGHRVPTGSCLLKTSQPFSKELQRDSKVSSGSMLSHPWLLPHSHITFQKMSSDPPKQAGIFTCVAKGPLLCATSGRCCLWPRCLITVLSGHQPLCSLGPSKSSPLSAGVYTPTTAPG